MPEQEYGVQIAKGDSKAIFVDRDVFESDYKPEGYRITGIVTVVDEEREPGEVILRLRQLEE